MERKEGALYFLRPLPCAEPQVPPQKHGLLMQVPGFMEAAISGPVWALLSVAFSTWSFRFQ